MIRKALIPIAGLGTRMYPLTRAIPKAMLPLPFGDKTVLPVVHWVCAEAAAGGIDEVMIIVSGPQEQTVRDYFAIPGQTDLLPLPKTIKFAVQKTPRGFGDAVACGADFVGDEPFMVLLGDHVYVSGVPERSCAGQVAEAHERGSAAAMIGIQVVRADDIGSVGVVAGEPLEGRLFRCRALMEKPDLTTARQTLTTPGLPEDKFLAHCGIYVFAPQIFECLSELSRRKRSGSNEVELAAAQMMLLERHPESCFLYRIEGHAYDTGTPRAYAHTFAALAGLGG